MSNAPFVFEPKNAYSLEELVECGYGRLFGPGKGVLPVDNMLMLDRITAINEDGGEFGRGKIIAELDIRPDLWFFNCHFPGDPVMPGCLGLDALWQLVGFWLCWSGREGKGRALGVGEVKFSGEVLPTSKLVTYELDITRTIDRRLTMGIANGTVAVDGREIYSTKSLKVGLFQSGATF